MSIIFLQDIISLQNKKEIKSKWLKLMISIMINDKINLNEAIYA